MEGIIIAAITSIITIVIAVISIRSSAKDTAKQIAALEESTTKQVESIKELARLQMDATIKQVELEIEKNVLLAKQAQQEWEGIEEINNSGMAHMLEWREEITRRFNEKKPERDYHLYSQFIKDLEKIKKGLVASKKNLN
jgi:hypothetical protein